MTEWQRASYEEHGPAGRGWGRKELVKRPGDPDYNYPEAEEGEKGGKETGKDGKGMGGKSRWKWSKDKEGKGTGKMRDSGGSGKSAATESAGGGGFAGWM